MSTNSIAPPKSSLQLLVLAGFGLLALALLVPLASLGRWMIEHEYYQHYPVLVIGSIALSVYRIRRYGFEYAGVVTLRVLVFGILAISWTAAVFILPSRWSASVAALFLLMAICDFAGGHLFGRRMFGSILLLAAAIPMPVSFDNWFVVMLQQLATRLASLWLEFMGVMHLATGVAIETPGETFFVEDACSGIHSVFAALAVGVAYGVIRQYRLVRLLVVLLQLLFWVVAANGLRVFFTVYGQTELGWDLSNASTHEVVGFVTFTLGVLLAISGDHFLRYLRPVTPYSLEIVPEPRGVGKLLAWLDQPLSLRMGAGLMAAAILSVLPVVGLYSKYRFTGSERTSNEDLASSSVIEFSAVDENFLPVQLDGWTRTGFTVKNRGRDSVFGGMVSFIWQYTGYGRSVLVSLDGPYEDWHDLAVCYQASGWNIPRMTEIKEEIGGWELSAAELSLAKAPLDRGHVLYVCIDPKKDDVPPPPFAGMAFRQFIHRFRLGMRDAKDHGGGVVQLQLYNERPGEFSQAQLEQNRRLFWAFTKYATDRMQPRGGGASE